MSFVSFDMVFISQETRATGIIEMDSLLAEGDKVWQYGTWHKRENPIILFMKMCSPVLIIMSCNIYFEQMYIIIVQQFCIVSNIGEPIASGPATNTQIDLFYIWPQLCMVKTMIRYVRGRSNRA